MKAIITGITGQCGSYLCELLLSKGYEVHGIIRRSSSINTDRIDHLYEDLFKPSKKLFLHYGDILDPVAIARLIIDVKPDEVYNLAAQSHVRVSFDIPVYTTDVTGAGVVHLLELLREHHPSCRFYQASSSEIFGSSPPPQNEDTPFCPRSPYAAAKLLGYWNTRIFREAYNMFAVNGILFNTESPRRGETFVTRKITKAVAKIVKGTQKNLVLGNLDAHRDWSFAPESCEAMWMMLQQDKPDDYVISTGESHTIREFVEIAFGMVGLDWQKYVETNPIYRRPLEVDHLCGDASKARRILGWKPKTTFRELVKIMVTADLEKEGLSL